MSCMKRSWKRAGSGEKHGEDHPGFHGYPEKGSINTHMVFPERPKECVLLSDTGRRTDGGNWKPGILKLPKQKTFESRCGICPGDQLRSHCRLQHHPLCQIQSQSGRGVRTGSERNLMINEPGEKKSPHLASFYVLNWSRRLFRVLLKRAKNPFS